MSCILIVEDDRSIADVLALLFADEGYTVRVAYDGAAALALLERAPVDLVLCDVHMPIMDGLTLLERMRERRLNAPFALMSAGYLKDLPASISVPFIGKPFDPDELLAMMARILRERDQGGPARRHPPPP